MFNFDFGCRINFMKRVSIMYTCFPQKYCLRKSRKTPKFCNQCKYVIGTIVFANISFFCECFFSTVFKSQSRMNMVDY